MFKKAVLKIVLFISLPIIFLWVIEVVCLPINYFNHRNWEALSLHSKIPHYGAFYPNITISSAEVGDLAHHTKFAIEKKVTWKTDEMGYRNGHFIKNPNVVIIGDSFMAGTSLTQENIFSNQLSKSCNNQLKIYNLAPATFYQWVNLLESKIIEKPEYVVFSIVERNIPEVYSNQNINYNSKKEKVKKIIRDAGIAQVDRLTRFYSLKWAASRMKNNKLAFPQSPVNPKMFFLNGKKNKFKNDGDIENAIQAIVSYKKYCDEKGVKFIFIPIPDKETIYYDMVPYKNQPDYINKLCSKLSALGVDNINTVLVMSKEKQLLYHYDDTHWNQYGVKVVVDALKKKLGNYR